MPESNPINKAREARGLLAEWDRAATPKPGERVHNSGGFAMHNNQEIRATLRDLIAEYERLTTPPTEDEREQWVATLEALLADVYTILKPAAEGTHGAASPVLRAFALLDAQEFALVRGPVTDEAIEAEADRRYPELVLAPENEIRSEDFVQGAKWARDAARAVS